ncbi:hypothetical protein AVEN_7584-1 [Araneus ventricosus]|uniref:Uncharacterized protein n=1 Tax=Araneus ventricosus TaxID=182803 RepID=A0A4Y2RLB9_ARAVE|nr:hypothetical protein AVEN_7584-1 [Araneus ventricosus]
MIIGVDRGKVWNSNFVGFPFIPFDHKNEKRSFEADDKSTVCGGGAGRGMCVGTRMRNQGREERVLSPESENPQCAGGGLKWLVVRFEASMNDPPKSIALNVWKTNLVQMESSDAQTIFISDPPRFVLN